MEATEIVEFLEAATHTLLKARGVYPAALFIRAQKYGTMVWQSRHPWLNQYIRDALLGIKACLEDGTLESFVLVISPNSLASTSSAASEKFRFEFRPATSSDNQLALSVAFGALMTKLGAVDAHGAQRSVERIFYFEITSASTIPPGTGWSDHSGSERGKFVQPNTVLLRSLRTNGLDVSLYWQY